MRDSLHVHSTAILVAVVAVFLIRSFYRAFESKWPENYFGGEGGIDPVVSRTPWRYGAFRLAPVAAAFCAAGTVGVRLGCPRAEAVGYTVALHLLTGPVIGLITAWKTRRIGLAAYRWTTIVACSLIGWAVASYGDHADTYIPDSHELAGALWTGVAVIAIAELALSLTGRTLKPRDLMSLARSTIAPDLLTRIRESGLADSAAVEAIALAEELNRPRWARRIERVLVPRSGTYGLMQVKARRPISDAESVDAYLVGQLRCGEYPVVEDQEADLRAFFLRHNDDANFADLATRLYWEIRRDNNSANVTTTGVNEERDEEGASRLALRSSSLAVGGALFAVGAVLIRRRFRATT